MLRVILLLTACAFSNAAPRNLQITQTSAFADKTKADGYYSESHQLTTSDGYILEINRIPYPRYQNESTEESFQRPVVFVMHGLQNSAIGFTVLGPSDSIAYNLADAGFDVWLGNARGVKNSRNHVKLDPDDPVQKLEFFDFTFEEIALIDVPAMIDYALKYTGKSQLHYIGHSQGGTVFLILNSLMPEYNQKFKSVHLLAGVGYQDYFPSVVLAEASNNTDSIYALARNYGYVEVFGPNDNERNLVAARSSNEKSLGNIIASVIETLAEIYRGYESLAGAAIKQFAHYGQNIRDKSFRRWNYGTLGNLIRYQTINPPTYDLEQITADVTMHYTLGDVLLDERDVLAMAKVMTNTRARKLSKETFTHTGFILSPEVRTLATNYIIAEIKSKYLACQLGY